MTLFYFTKPGEVPADGLEFPDAEAALHDSADAALAIAREERLNDFALSVSSDQEPVGEVIVRLEVTRNSPHPRWGNHKLKIPAQIGLMCREQVTPRRALGNRPSKNPSSDQPTKTRVPEKGLCSTGKPS